MSNTHNSESPELVQAKIDTTHQQLVPVYIKEPDKSVIDSYIVKWISKGLMAIMTLIVIPVALACGYHAYDKLENHGELLAVVVSNQTDMKNAVSELSKKFDTVVGQVNDDRNSITALNTEVQELKNNPPFPLPVEREQPQWHPRRDNTPPIVRAIEHAIDPRHTR